MSKQFNLVIAGGRTFNDYNRLKDQVDRFLMSIALMHVGMKLVIVSGTANGADKLGERYAAERGHKLIPMPANWEQEGRSAGYRRNERMAQIANAVIVFWDGKSRGTAHMIECAKQKRIPLAIVYDQGSVVYVGLSNYFPASETIDITEHGL